MKFNKNNKTRKTLLRRFLPVTVALLLAAPAFAQDGAGDETKDSRAIEFEYKQRHSNIVTSQQHLFADGIKIKRDLSLLKEVREQRVLAADEIPAEDLYGGIWVSNKVAAYNDILKQSPDTFDVDLSGFTMPAMGHVTSPFGMRRRRMHYGMDIKVQTGDTIYAAFDGKIRVRQYERRGYGYYLVLRHPNGLETVYGHLSKFLANVDDVVKSGQPIGLGGNTGRSFGSHLHFEVRYLGKHMDPREIIDFNNKVCHKDSYTITPSTFNYYGSKYRTYDPKAPNKYTSGGMAYHRIKSGDTLGGIARKYGTTVSQLCRLNGMKSTSVLRIGKSIRIS
ncbi:M23 family metallopeptidase [Dysgonomonas sp. 25]|uniref:M23 family metallopeptidase n=1 Tax=Dysgonomonas sp. 25 TaxID=2302933 RepID=UPI0013D1382F|nr:M23 family metallopeptidase [Dysgonomonas sp. 25]NDV68100.1 LysM peptidoglycan-binding domain-containing protein [Dysgonomonas sp. 25]